MSYNRNIVLCLFGAMTLLLSCSKPWSANSYRNTSEDDTYKLYDLYVDEYGNKGIVAWKYYYKWKNGDVTDRMLVLSLDEAFLPWGPMNERVYLADSIPLPWRFGVAMLQSMYDRGIERYPAMNWCNQKNRGDKPYSGSWRLPVKTEWNTMLDDDDNPLHLQAINQALKKYGGTPLDEEEMYWMAGEDYEGYVRFDSKDIETDYDPYNRAVAMNAEIKLWTDKDRWLKKLYNRVRAVKYVVFRDE